MNDEPRVLPHNLEAERAVLGAAIINNAGLDRASEILRPEDFFRRGHQILWRIMLALAERGTAIDLLTVKAEVERLGESDETGGPAYLSALTDGVPRSVNITHYALLVREDAARRAVIKSASALLDGAYEREAPAAELLTAADQALLELRRHGGRDSLQPVGERVDVIFRSLEERAKNPGALIGIDTGFKSLNDCTLGWRRGEMTIVAARPSIGKTAFTLNTAMAAARNGFTVAIFSLEMTREQLDTRMLASLAQVPASTIEQGSLGEPEYERVALALGELSQLKLWIDDTASLTALDIRSRCRRLKAEQGQLDLVVVDYIQLVNGTGTRHQTRNEVVTDISRRLKVMAGELDCAVLVLSQLSRAAEERAGMRPRLSDLRESGALEQDADAVCFLHRKDHRASGETLFIIEKQRNGPTGARILSFDRYLQTFTDTERDADAEQAERAAAEPKPEQPKPPKGWRRKPKSY